MGAETSNQAKHQSIPSTRTHVHCLTESCLEFLCTSRFDDIAHKSRVFVQSLCLTIDERKQLEIPSDICLISLCHCIVKFVGEDGKQIRLCVCQCLCWVIWILGCRLHCCLIWMQYTCCNQLTTVNSANDPFSMAGSILDALCSSTAAWSYSSC